MDTAWLLAGCLSGGLLAGLVALVVGGIGGAFQLRRSLNSLAEVVEELHLRVEREVKRRASDLGVKARHSEATVEDRVAQLLESRPPDTPPSRAEILKLGRQRGLVR